MAPDAAAPTVARPARRRRRWSFVFTALLLGLLLAAVLLEAAFRLLWPLPPAFAEFQQAGLYVATADGDVALKPGYRGSLQVGGGRSTAVAIDGLGMRGPELPSKAPGERRVLVVGDSLVFGYGVEAEEALPARLAAALAGLTLPSTVGNGGVPGYGSRHAVQHMARLDGAFLPDAFVLCSYLGNDALDDLGGERTVFAGLWFEGAMARLVRTSWRTRLAIRSRAALWLETWIYTNHPAWSPLLQMAPTEAELQLKRGLPGTPPAAGQPFAGLFLDVVDEARCWDPGAPPILPRVLANLRTSLQRAKEVAGDRPLLFVVLPTCWHVVEPMRQAKLQELGFEPSSFRRGTAQARWTGVARELGIDALDATPILAAQDGDQRELFVEDGGHLSGRGNDVLAQWLGKELAGRLR